MKPQAYKKASISPELDRVQEYIAQKFQQFDALPFAAGTLLRATDGSERITINGATEFNHSLGQTPMGFMLLGKFGNADIWQNDADATTITLDSTTSVSAVVWVF